MSTPSSAFTVRSIAWWHTEDVTLPVLIVNPKELPKKMQDEWKNTQVETPTTVKLFQKEDPFRIISSSTLLPFNDENNRKYKDGTGEDKEESAAQFVRAYYASQCVEDERDLVEADEDLGCFKCFSQYTEENETQKSETMIACEKCGFWFHLPCVGLTVAPEGDYVCEECRQELKRKAPETTAAPVAPEQPDK